MTVEVSPLAKLENPLYALIRAGVPEGMSLLHVVAFKFLSTTGEEQQVALMQECEALFGNCGGNEAGINSLRAMKNIDPRKGFVWVEVGVFASAEAFIDFHRHPAHTAFSSKMASLADVWVVQDIAVAPGTIV